MRARFALAAALWLPAALAADPAPPVLAAESWLLVDYDSGATLAAREPARALAPASLTKLMTAYLLFEALAEGRWRLDEHVAVSARAAGQKGARVFLAAGGTARAEELLTGMLVRSGNDATVALVEHVAGDEAAFAARMNAKAQALGLEDTHFVNATGLDAPGQLSSARDLTRLAAALLRDFPEHYPRFRQREASFNGLTQHNRNALLWRDASVDGIKTGQTRAAGYCVIASARRGGMRLIATVLGARDDSARFDAAQQLLEYGFRHYETRLLYANHAPAARTRVWLGARSELALGPAQALYVTLPRGAHARLRTRLHVADLLTAPIAAGRRAGTLVVELDGRTLAEAPLVALEAIGRGNVLQRAVDRIQLWIR